MGVAHAGDAPLRSATVFILMRKDRRGDGSHVLRAQVLRRVEN